MKLIFLSTIFFLITSGSLNAQFNLSMRSGPVISTIINYHSINLVDKSEKGRLDFFAELCPHYNFSKKWATSIGIGFSRKGKSFDIWDFGRNGIYNYEIRVTTIDLVHEVGYSLNSFLRAGLGGYFSYRLRSERRLDYDMWVTATGEFEKLDMGISASVTARYKNFEFFLRSNHGLRSVENRAFAIALGIPISKNYMRAFFVGVGYRIL